MGETSPAEGPHPRANSPSVRAQTPDPDPSEPPPSAGDFPLPPPFLPPLLAELPFVSPLTGPPELESLLSSPPDPTPPALVLPEPARADPAELSLFPPCEVAFAIPLDDCGLGFGDDWALLTLFSVFKVFPVLGFEDERLCAESEEISIAAWKAVVNAVSNSLVLYFELEEIMVAIFDDLSVPRSEDEILCFELEEIMVAIFEVLSFLGGEDEVLRFELGRLMVAVFNVFPVLERGNERLWLVVEDVVCDERAAPRDSGTSEERGLECDEEVFGGGEWEGNGCRLDVLGEDSVGDGGGGEGEEDGGAGGRAGNAGEGTVTASQSFTNSLFAPAPTVQIKQLFQSRPAAGHPVNVLLNQVLQVPASTIHWQVLFVILMAILKLIPKPSQ